MNAGRQPNVGKLRRVFAPSYLGLRALYPNAFAIRPCGHGYEGIVETKEGASNVRN